jgi:hypothetical protein
MSRLAIVFACILVAASAAGYGQAAPPAAAAAPAATCPATPTLDKLIVALDAAVSGPADQDRTCFRALFLPGASFMPMATTNIVRILTTDDWIAAVAKRGHDPFYEVQTKYSTETFGHVAHLWSTYEVRPTPDGKPEIRGINSIQAIFDGQNWKIINILWQSENPATPIPAQYLP